MKFSLSFLLAATALLGASGEYIYSYILINRLIANNGLRLGSIADEVEPSPGSSGCSASEGSCWASCYDGESGPEIDAYNTWEEGDPWCWLAKQTGTGEGWDWVGCEDESSCSIDIHSQFCDYMTRDTCQS